MYFIFGAIAVYGGAELWPRNDSRAQKPFARSLFAPWNSSAREGEEKNLSGEKKRMCAKAKKKKPAKQKGAGNAQKKLAKKKQKGFATTTHVGSVGKSSRWEDAQTFGCECGRTFFYCPSLCVVISAASFSDICKLSTFRHYFPDFIQMGAPQFMAIAVLGNGPPKHEKLYFTRPSR